MLPSSASENSGAAGRTSALGVAVAVVLVAAGVVAMTFALAGPRSWHGLAVAASGAPPSPSRPKPYSLVPPLNPDWHAAVSTTRNAAFDVPPSWRVESATRVVGYRDIGPDRQTVVLSGTADYQQGACLGKDHRYTALAGVTGSPDPDLARAATDRARLWALGMFDAEDSAVTLSPPRALELRGRAAQHVTATVTKTQCAQSPRGVVHTVALAGNGPDAVVFVLGAELGAPGAVNEADLEPIALSIRPGGLVGAQCERGRPVVGTWC